MDQASNEDARVARFGLRVAAGLNEQAQTLPANVAERLSFAREQALLKARSARASQAQAAPAAAVMRSGSALSLGRGGDSPRWLKLTSLLPLILLVLGLMLIQHSQWYEQILAAAEVDTGLLSDKLPPAAYGDPGFKEYLSDEPEEQ
ncbi:DUF3619 family protein [Roseateles oligotrophus]|uniref:DUF3619 family protein n=1 Tax=Roseateles oligotrophus TaxID=1769250 RepID=A0ABT2YAW9_9BURK|nr:DUF3619 family protein [Roseateles oligotrophus]MCV2367452.1 DUF3619 family protein [Roseateles oligotrophus]